MSDTPRTDAVSRFERDDPWINDTVVYADFARILERELTAVHADRDALREDNNQLRRTLLSLIDAAELGLEYAEAELDGKKVSFKGYPDRWELDERYVQAIRAAIDAAKRAETSPKAESQHQVND